MGQERLSALVLMSVHKDFQLDLDDIAGFHLGGGERGHLPPLGF